MRVLVYTASSTIQTSFLFRFFLHTTVFSTC